jgi:hypothetical protein
MSQMGIYAENNVPFSAIGQRNVKRCAVLQIPDPSNR